MEVKIGTSQASASMTTQLQDYPNVTDTSWQTASINDFTVASDGTYYIGFHTNSPVVGSFNHVAMDDIILTASSGLKFYNLTINSRGQSVAFSNNLVVKNNLVTNATTQLDVGTNNLTVEGTVTNNGSLKQTIDASTVSTMYDYLTIKNAAGDTTKYYGVNITPTGGPLGSTAVIISGSRDCVSPADVNLVQRCFDITPTTATAATIKYWFTNAEQNGRTANALKVWDYNGTSWAQVGAVVPGGTYGAGASCTTDASCWAQWEGISTFSPMALGDNTTVPTGSPVGPLAVDLAGFVADDLGDHVLLTWETVTELDNLGFNLYRSANERDLANRIRINDALIASQAPGSGQGFAYDYEDDQVEAGASYFYWLEDIDVSGNTTLRGPISISLAMQDAPTALTTSDLAVSGQISIAWALAPVALMLLMGGLLVMRRRRRR